MVQTSDTAGYDEYVEGVEADEVTSLETPLPEVCAYYHSNDIHTLNFMLPDVCGSAAVVIIFSLSGACQVQEC